MKIENYNLTEIEKKTQKLSSFGWVCLADACGIFQSHFNTQLKQNNLRTFRRGENSTRTFGVPVLQLLHWLS